MNEILSEALREADIGVIIIDPEQRVVFWNRYLENISLFRETDVLHKKLEDVAGLFARGLFQSALKTVLVNNQSRFFSCKIHKAFVYPNDGASHPELRQNMKMGPLAAPDGTYALIQISDVTEMVNNEHKLTSFITELRRGYAEIQQSEQAIKKMAETDPLTGLLNRHALMESIGLMLQQSKDIGSSSLMFLDLDNFKDVNDSYGHNTGDALLVHIAQKLREHTRREDLVARLGGDEFVLLVRTRSPEDLRAIAKKLIAAVAEPVIIDGHEIHVTVSIGISVYEDDITATREFLERADRAMYQSKHSGKNTFDFYVSSRPDDSGGEENGVKA